MRTCILLTVLFCTIMHYNVECSPDGAPCPAHDSMKPDYSAHGPATAEGSGPYDVLVLDSSNEEVSCYSTGKTYTVKIQPKSGDSIRGFIIQARDSSDNTVGTFDIENSYSVKKQCKTKKDSVTQAGPDDKSSVSAKWSTESEAGTLTFKATVVKKLTEHYVKIPSKPISVCN